MISVIIPVYLNKPELYLIIDKCLKSVPKDCELITVDDCSPLEVPWEMTYRNEVNKGFTATVNKGLSLATGNSLVVMNDDITLEPGDLDMFCDEIEGIISPKTIDEGLGDNFGSIWGMSRATYELLGGLDENLVHYFSDLEYYHRAKSKGVPVTKRLDVCVSHVGSATYGEHSHSYKQDKETWEKIYENRYSL